MTRTPKVPLDAKIVRPSSYGGSCQHEGILVPFGTNYDATARAELESLLFKATDDPDKIAKVLMDDCGYTTRMAAAALKRHPLAAEWTVSVVAVTKREIFLRVDGKGRRLLNRSVRQDAPQEEPAKDY